MKIFNQLTFQKIETFFKTLSFDYDFEKNRETLSQHSIDILRDITSIFGYENIQSINFGESQKIIKFQSYQKIKNLDNNYNSVFSFDLIWAKNVFNFLGVEFHYADFFDTTSIFFHGYFPNGQYITLINNWFEESTGYYFYKNLIFSNNRILSFDDTGVNLTNIQNNLNDILFFTNIYLPNIYNSTKNQKYKEVISFLKKEIIDNV